MKLECPWKGCNGVIDVLKDIEQGCAYKGSVKAIHQTSFIIHTVTCPKCHNAVGNFDWGPGCWSSADSDIQSIHQKRKVKGKVIWALVNVKHELKLHSDYNRYLKPWARAYRHRKAKK